MAWVSAPSLAPLPIAVAAWAIVSAAAGALGWAVWLAAGGGRALAQRYLCALGLGYALVGYGVLALGLTGHLSPLPMAVLVCGAAVAGIRCIGPLFAVTFAGLGRGAAALRGSRFRVLYGVVLACAAITFLAALGPSDGRDWDGLSEHLAQAKTYLRHHRVEPLWWDHHSHFPAAVVMLYCLGMAFGGQGAAKLFHWGFGVLSLLALWRFSRRHLRTASGGPGAWVLATTPLFGWLATVGYVDLAAVFYSIMACDGVLAWLSERRREDFLQAAVMAGCGMTAKAQGLFTFGVLLIFMGSFVLRQKCRVRELLAFSAIALAIAAPWYIKSWVVTGNPVYPFAYGIFGGKHWSSEQARHYAYHHASFGYGKLPPEDEWQKWPLWKKRLGGPRHPLMMLLAPVTLTLFPEYWEPRHPRLAAALMLSIGPMYLALAPLLLLGGAVGRRPQAARIAALFSLFWVWWLLTTQLVRYLLPWLTLVAALAGQALADRLERKDPVGRAYWTVTVVWSALALAAVILHAGPVVATTIGLRTPDQHLRSSLDCYEAMKYLNIVVPARAKVGTYGEPRTFYIDRDAIWIDPGHSQLIDYPNIHTAAELVGAIRRLGIEYILVNQQFFGPVSGSGDELHQIFASAIEEMLLLPVADFAKGKIVVLEVRQ